MILYPHPDTGQPIVTHSMIKAFRRCPKQTQYKYAERLKPKVESSPLKRGKWIHAILEAHYKGGDWKAEHAAWTQRFNKLFEEEQEKLGDLPTDITKLMRGYFWHYKHDADWQVLETEFTIETELPDGTLYRCRVDNLVETPYGIYLVDHKSHNVLPDTTFRLLDAQSALYIWAARRNGIPVRGFIWNYIRAKPQAEWRFKKDGDLYAKIGDTDYPTALTCVKREGKNPADFADKLNALKKMRYEHGAMQLSPFYRRDVLEKQDDVIKAVVQEAIHTVKRMRKYPFHKQTFVERNPERSCVWGCSYRNLCETELMGGNADMVRKREFRIGDPMDYYQDTREEDTAYAR